MPVMAGGMPRMGFTYSDNSDDEDSDHSDRTLFQRIVGIIDVSDVRGGHKV